MSEKLENTILLVEDSEFDRKYLALQLRDAGYSVVESEDGREIDPFPEQSPIDLILLDVVLPNRDGLALLTKLRLKHSPIGLPVIMLTSRGASADIVNGLSLGANDYVAKPADLKVLLARVKTHLSLKQAKAALRESEERYSLAIQGANDGIWDWNLATGEIFFSTRWKALLGYSEHEFTDSVDGWYRAIHNEDLPRVQEAVKFLIDALNDHLEVEYRMVDKAGQYRWMLTRGMAVRTTAGKAYRLAGSQTDISDRKLTDALTGLPNRALFMDRLSQATKLLRWQTEATFGVCLVNIDRFTIVNESMGHGVGDQLLQEVSRRLLECLRPEDTAARFGGDEFVVLMDDLPDNGEVPHFVDRVQKKMSLPFRLGGKEFIISVSVGIVNGSCDYQNADDIVRDAQTALRRAKARGLNNFEVFDPTMHALVVHRFQMEGELKQAIDQDQLFLHFHPIVSVVDDGDVGYEALVRWNHGPKGRVLPEDFIPIAEETGLIVPLGESILRSACVAMKGIEQRGLGKHFVTVNFSVRQFQQPNLTDMVDRILKISDFDPQFLKIELTESILMDNSQRNLATLHRLRDMSLQILVDDFGTGYSSLAYLKKFPITALKIDQSFVKDLETDLEAASIVRVIIAMAHNLGLTVIAEGVETEAQFQFLKDHRCDAMQGYLFSLPIPIEELELYLSSHASGTPGSVGKWGR